MSVQDGETILDTYGPHPVLCQAGNKNAWLQSTLTVDLDDCL